MDASRQTPPCASALARIKRREIKRSPCAHRRPDVHRDVMSPDILSMGPTASALGGTAIPAFRTAGLRLCFVRAALRGAIGASTIAHQRASNRHVGAIPLNALASMAIPAFRTMDPLLRGVKATCGAIGVSTNAPALRIGRPGRTCASSHRARGGAVTALAFRETRASRT